MPKMMPTEREVARVMARIAREMWGANGVMREMRKAVT